MQIGIILFYLPEKGYGYLRLLDTREEFHFRKKNLLLREIKAGDLVSFEMKQGSQGYFADQVQRKGIA
jgi:cold shock CspA family protein